MTKRPFQQYRETARVRLWKSMILVAGLALGGCSVAPTPAPISVRTQSAVPIEPFWVRTYQVQSGVLVTGQVRSRGRVLSNLRGHLHVIATFVDGRAPLVAETRWGPSPRRGRGSAGFRSVLKAVAADQIERVTVEYVNGAMC